MAKPPPTDSSSPGRLSVTELLRRIAGLPTEAERERAKRALLLQYKPTAIVGRTKEAEALEAEGWEPWLAELAPAIFKGSHADFHRKFWDWYWPLLLAKRDGQSLVQLDIPLAYLLTLARGQGKSTSVEWATIALGALIGQVLTVYVSSTAKLAAQHLNNIREEIEDSAISKYYPGLAHPEIGKFDNRYGWNQTLLASQSGLTIFAVGLEEEVRGLKRRHHRPSLIVLDEFDSKNDSPDVVLKKEAIIGGSVFGTQVPDTLIVLAQNLIHSQSVATRTVKRRNQLLSRRVESGVIKAFSDDLEIAMVGTRYMAIKGQPTWDYFNKASFQKFLDISGPIEVYAEYQHEFTRDHEGKVFKNYNDRIHVITEEEFKRVYKVDRVPPSWNKYVFNDVARTKTEYHANVAGTLTMSGMNSALPGITFLYDCISSDEDTQVDDFAVEILKRMTPYVNHEGAQYLWEDLVQVVLSREGIDRFTGTLKDEVNARRAGLARIIPPYVRPILSGNHYTKFRMSHEKDDWRRVYRETFGLPFVAANPTDGAGVDLMNLAMKVDPNIKDPFGRTNPDGSPLMGLSRFYVIVKYEDREYPDDNKPDLLHGTDLARYQFKEHRWLTPKINALGETERGQEKRNDDYPNGCQFFFMDHSIVARELSPAEMAEALMEPHLRLESIQAEADPDRRQSNTFAREIALKKQAAASIARRLSGDGKGSKLSDYRRLERRGL